MRRGAWIIAALLWLLAMTTTSGAQDPKAVYLDGFTETKTDELSVGGELLFGLRPNILLDAPPDTLVLWPPAQARRVCVEINSIDGLYAAKAQIKIPEGLGSVVLLPLEFTSTTLTRRTRAQLFENYGESELISRAFLSADCIDLSSATIIPTSLRLSANLGNSELQSWQLFVNSEARDAELVFATLGSRIESQRFPCRQLRSTRRTRMYDTVCEINDPTTFDLSRGTLEFRSFGELDGPPVDVRLHLPGTTGSSE